MASGRKKHTFFLALVLLAGTSVSFADNSRLPDGTEFPNHGRIAFADASFSAETGTYLVRAEVSNPEGTLRPGQFVNIAVDDQNLVDLLCRRKR